MSASNQSQDQELFYPTTAGNPMQPAPATDQAWQQQSAANEQTPAYMQHMTLVLVILHLSVFISGLVGNSLVCLSVYRNKSLQTVTNYYIVNLAVADFLVILICLPPTVYWDLTLTWNFGLIPCKLVLYLQVSTYRLSGRQWWGRRASPAICTGWWISISLPAKELYPSDLIALSS